MQAAESLSDLLADAGIRLKSQRPGHNEHLLCPRCGGGRTREKSLSVTIDDDGLGATWICHRGHCGWTSGGRLGSRGIERERPVRRPEPHSAVQEASRPDWLFRWFSARRIGEKTLESLGVYAVDRRRFPRAGDVPAIVFPYRWRGELVNRKYRAYAPEKDHGQEADALPTLFNVDALGDAPEEIVWVEGEPDVAAMWECGIKHAVTLKDGAPAEAKFRDDDKRFEALRTHVDVLGKARRIILAGDNDAPGLALREELARRLGRHRCRVVTWPGGCKDACDTLREHGPEAVLGCIAEARPYPIDGLISEFAGRLLAYRDQPAPAVMTSGTAATDAILRLPTEGRLIVLTGWPSSGKSAWATFVMMHTARYHDRRWCVFSPEMQPWEHYAVTCAEALIGKPFWPVAGRERMSVPETMQAERWLTDRVVMMVCDSEDQSPTLDWILERARAAVLRDGTTDLLIDPWNEIEHARGRDTTETEYIGRSLQRLKAFGLRHGCNVWVVTHPAKPMPLKPGEKRGAAGPYDQAGSAHWVNKADVGLTLHSPEAGLSQVIVWKSRFRRWGKRNEMAELAYDETTGRYADREMVE